MPLRDLALAGRTLRKSPVFALTAALTIALGVGARIAFGRDFSDDDGQPQPPPPAPGAKSATPPQRLPIMAIISYEYFQRRFGSNPAVLGQSLNKGKPFSPRIVGVLAPHFQIYFPPSADLEAAPDIWIANRLGYDAAQRNAVSMRVIGRLKPGVTIGRAQA